MEGNPKHLIKENVTLTVDVSALPSEAINRRVDLELVDSSLVPGITYCFDSVYIHILLEIFELPMTIIALYFVLKRYSSPS